jgi:hypothetical protein
MGAGTSLWDADPVAPCIQSALLFASDMGDSISYAAWMSELQQRGLTGRWSTDDLRRLDVTEVLVSICRIAAKYSNPQFDLPSNLIGAVELAVGGSPDTRLVDVLVSDTQKRIRHRIRQHIRHSGGANARWLGQDLGVDSASIETEMASLGLARMAGDWFSPPSSPDGPDDGHLEVLHRAMCKMSSCCGPLDIQTLCGGIRKANFRKQFPVPPPDIMGHLLIANGYACEEGLYWWGGSTSVELSASEAVILRAFRSVGTVLNHEELAEAIRAAGLSFPALYNTLKHSPLFRRVEPGLYVVRGTRPSVQELERARGASQDVPLNLEVGYEAGCVLVSMSVSVISLVVGTIAITSPDFPNLAGDWTCMAGNDSSYAVRVTERGISGLRFMSEELGIQPGDRIALTFNPRLHAVSISLVEKAQTW